MQITVLVAMSVLLLTVPWMKDHPVTLLVPLALCVVPATASVLRPLLAEVFMSLLGAANASSCGCGRGGEGRQTPG